MALAVVCRIAANVGGTPSFAAVWHMFHVIAHLVFAQSAEAADKEGAGLDCRCRAQ